MDRTPEGLTILLSRHLCGKQCWDFRLTYPDELALHIGQKIPYNHPKLEGDKGEWILGTCCTSWVIYLYNQVISSEQNKPDLDKVFETVKDIKNILVSSDFSLTIEFQDNCIFRIIPLPEDFLIQVPFWELMGPDDFYVYAGPDWGPDSSWPRLDEL